MFLNTDSENGLEYQRLTKILNLSLPILKTIYLKQFRYRIMHNHLEQQCQKLKNNPMPKTDK